jgi:molybdate transport system substrate-binding protein
VHRQKVSEEERMKYLISSMIVVLILLNAHSALAAEVTVLAPGGMRCALGKFSPEFEKKTGNKVNWTTGSGGQTHERIAKGEAVDVPIVQPPYQDVIQSGNVVASSEKPLAIVPIMVAVKKGKPHPDISSAEAIKKMLLNAKAISYPDGSGGAAAGVSFDKTLKQLGIYEQMMPKVKRMQGVTLMQLLTRGEIDYAITFNSEIDDPDADVVGQLPRDISTPTSLVGFVSAHAKAPEAAKAFLAYISGSEAVAGYKACGMTPGK